MMDFYFILTAVVSHLKGGTADIFALSWGLGARGVYNCKQQQKKGEDEAAADQDQDQDQDQRSRPKFPVLLSVCVCAFLSSSFFSAVFSTTPPSLFLLLVFFWCCSWALNTSGKALLNYHKNYTKKREGGRERALGGLLVGDLLLHDCYYCALPNLAFPSPPSRLAPSGALYAAGGFLGG